jgi:hypothetical protein
MSEDRNQQALDLLTQPGARVTEWNFGFTVGKGVNSQFFNKTELEAATIKRLQAVAVKPGMNPAKPKARRRYSKRRPSAAAVLSMAYEATAKLVDRVNSEKKGI